MTRDVLSAEQWERMRPLLPPEKPRTGCPAKDYCVVVNGWKDLIAA
jgi:transposase